MGRETSLIAVKIVCTTNIDCAKVLKWPDSLPARPMVGDLIRSDSSTPDKHIELEVVRVTWIRDNCDLSPEKGEMYAQVELWMVQSRFVNLTAFERWVTGRNY